MTRFVRNPAARVKHVGAGVALYIPSTEAVHSLNETAQLLFECLEEPMSRDDLVELFLALTDGGRAEVEADLDSMLLLFEDLQIAVPS